MARLEDIRVGSRIQGLSPEGVAKIKAVQFFGDQALDVVVSDQEGHLGQRKCVPEHGRDAGKIAEEVIQHPSTLLGASVEVTMEIHARLPGGVDAKTVRDVTENARDLKFKDHGFTKE
jgi:hypothetical protein